MRKKTVKKVVCKSSSSHQVFSSSVEREKFRRLGIGTIRSWVKLPRFHLVHRLGGQNGTAVFGALRTPFKASRTRCCVRTDQWSLKGPRTCPSWTSKVQLREMVRG
jgi:hypothetical protein